MPILDLKVLALLSVLVVETTCLVKRYGTNLEYTNLAIAYHGSLTSSYNCAGVSTDLGTYNLSYIVAGAPLEIYEAAYGIYGDTWERNPFHFGFFHSSSVGYFTTEDYVYGLQFSTAAWPTYDSVYDTSKAGERLLNLDSPSVNIGKALVGGQQGYIIAGDQMSIDRSAMQPNSVGLYLPGNAGLPGICGPRNIVFNWTQALPFNWSIGFSNTTAWFNLISGIGNGTTVSIALNATRVLDDSVVRYSNTVLDSTNPQKPAFKNPAASSSTSSAAAATSSSVASARPVTIDDTTICLSPVGKAICGFVVQYVIGML